MSVTIDNSLLEFRDVVTPGLSSVPAMISNLTSKLGDLNSKANSAVSDLSASYSGDGLSTAVSAFNSINAAVEGIKASFSGCPQEAVSKSSELISKIGELDELKTKIDEIESELSKMGGRRSYNEDKSNKAEVDSHNNKISQLETEKSEKEAQFKSDQDNCLSQLEAIKGIDGSVDVSVQQQAPEQNAELITDINNLKYGEINYLEFKASTGRVIKCYVYVPADAQNIKNLPALLYMHGDATGDGDATRALRQGLPKLIQNKEVTPQGIVIMPYFPGYDQKNSAQALKELTNTIVEQYNCDKNKIAVAGHSRGGMMAYELVNTYPNYFSCCVPISGSAKVTDAFKTVKTWVFNSVNEGNRNAGCTYNTGVNAANNINKIGGTAKHTALRKSHKYTNEEAFQNEYESPDGKVETVLEWIFRQVKG